MFISTPKYKNLFFQTSKKGRSLFAAVYCMTPLFEKEETFELLLWNIYAIAMKLILSTNKKKRRRRRRKGQNKKVNPKKWVRAVYIVRFYSDINKVNVWAVRRDKKATKVVMHCREAAVIRGSSTFLWNLKGDKQTKQNKKRQQQETVCWWKLQNKEDHFTVADVAS